MNRTLGGKDGQPFDNFKINLNLEYSQIVSLTRKLVRNVKAKNEFSNYPSIMTINLRVLSSSGATVTFLSCS